MEENAGYKNDFISQSNAMLQAFEAEMAASRMARQRLDAFEALRGRLTKTLETFAKESEGRMGANEDGGKTLIQSGAATMDEIGMLLDDTFNKSFPVLKGAYALMRYAGELENVARNYVSVQDASKLPDLEKSFAKLIKKSHSRLRKIKSRVKSDEEKARIKQLGQMYKELKALVLGKDGAFAAYRSSLEAKASTTSLSVSLTQIGESYSAALADISAAANELSDSMSETTQDVINKALLTIGIIVVIGVVIALGLAVVLTRAITNPLKLITEAMKRLAEGDKAIELRNIEDKNEIGDMSRAVEVFKQNAIEAERLEQEQRAEQQAKETRTATVEAVIRRFDEAVKEMLGQVSAAAGQLNDTAASLTGTARVTEESSGTVAAAAEEASMNVNTMASSTEELSGSVDEISRQIATSTEIAEQAVTEAGQSKQSVEGLSEAANEIGAVVDIIRDIAGQTNLLALNATIEAARAGDAGKGFAVVASEVKNLATQTAKATEEVAEKIEAIQSSTVETAGKITEVAEIINQISQTSAAISSAVEEQSSSTQEIARSAQQAAGGTRQVTENITQVNAAAKDTGKAAGSVEALAGDLSGQSDKLGEVIQSFLAEVRQA